MIDGRRIVVVIPAYRAAATIGDVLDRMPPFVDRVVVVDDASPDDLAAVVASHRDPRVTLVRSPKNGGVGAATRIGIEHALEEGCDIIIKCDADGQMAPEMIPSLIQPLLQGSADFAKGCRFFHRRELRQMPTVRFLGSVVLTFAAKAASGYWNVLDPVNGFFALDAKTAAMLPLARLAPRFFFETDLLLHLNVLESRVQDVPLPAHYGEERSNLSVLRVLTEFPFRLISGFFRRIFWRYVFFDVSPVAVFLFVGLLLLTFGFSFGSYHWIKNAILERTTPLGTIMVAAMPLLFGLQLVLQAIVLDVQNTPRTGATFSAPARRMREMQDIYEAELHPETSPSGKDRIAP